MALPNDLDIQFQLLSLLDKMADGSMRSGDVYKRLADRFPELETDDVAFPFANSVSHWANRVQFARLHLVALRYLLPPHLSGRGVWTISPAGRLYIRQANEEAERMLDEICKN